MPVRKSWLLHFILKAIYPPINPMEISWWYTYSSLLQKWCIIKMFSGSSKALSIRGIMIKRVIAPRLLPKEVIDPELQEWGKSSDFTDLYLKSVQTYKRLFKNWQAGNFCPKPNPFDIILKPSKCKKDPALLLGLQFFYGLYNLSIAYKYSLSHCFKKN